MKKFFWIYLLVLYSIQTKGQIYTRADFGMRVGISITAGTHIQRLGFFVSAYYLVHPQHQINFIVRVHYNFKNLGAPLQYPELQAQITYLFGYFGQINFSRTFISEFDAKHQYKNSVGLFYKIYLDKARTTQPSGGFLLNFSKLTIVHENDMFGMPHVDKFRSGAVWVAYHHQNIIYSTKLMVWHGDGFDRGAKTVFRSDYPARFGYKDLSDAANGRFSHGILALNVIAGNVYGQYLQANIGADAEQIRNVFQNKIIHDMWFLPEALISYKLPNYPMLDTDGKPYLYHHNQKIRKSKFFFDTGINSTIFY